MIDFAHVNTIALPHIREWLPGGHEESGQWVCKNPTRDDRNEGSFKVNLTTGAANDFADDWYGHDAVSLYAYLNGGMRNIDAAKDIMGKYDPSYFPGEKDFDYKLSWRQLPRSIRNAPEFVAQPNEIARWPFEIKCGSDWRVVMWVVRFIEADGRKDDIPYTLWTDGQKLEWRKKALHGVKYPLYGLRALTERPNARVILYEGQKKAGVVQPVMGDDWVCVGFYGGAGNAAMSDFDPLLGREVWYPFDADAPGRKALKTVLDELHVKAHIVYPPADVPKGWDHADAILTDGWTKEDIERALLAATDPAPDAPVPALRPVLAESRPTKVDIPITQAMREYLLDNMYVMEKDNEGGQTAKMRTDWFYWLVDNDAAVRNSIKYDYTTGMKSTAYLSSELYEAALEQHLQDIGIPANYVTRTAKEMMTRKVQLMNSTFNRVADFIDGIIEEVGDAGDGVIDEFMKAFTFNFERKPDDRDYEERCKREEALYKELFHKFFLRMHGRIRGTRMTEAGGFFGPIANDIIPVLEGGQGIGKTTLCQWIACDEFLYIDLGSGLKQSFGSSETFKKCRGKMIVEIGEMGVMKSNDDVQKIKSFASAKFAEIDIKYVEGEVHTPLTFSCIGTDNSGQYLVDQTGNRRFFPIRLKDIDLDFLRDNRDLAKKIHAHYQLMAMKMTTDEILSACTTSKELDNMMNGLRDDAMIVYSDYEVCIKLIKAWKELHRHGDTFDQSDIEKAAIDGGYPARISRRSFTRAAADMGMVQARAWEGSRSMKVWKWEESVPF